MSILLSDEELCNIITTANNRDYSEIEFIGHISICQNRKTRKVIIERLEQLLKDNDGYIDAANFVFFKKEIMDE